MATLAPTSPLRGRAVELRTLVDALGRAAGGRSAVVIVEGEAGIGQSRLLAEALEAARARGLQVVTGRGQDLERNRPFGLLADSLGCSRSSPDPRRAAIAALLATHDGERGVATVSSDPGLQFQAVDAFLELMEALALQGPLVLGLDDLQWADPSSLLTLEALAGRLTDSPVALLASLRPLPRGAELERALAALDAAVAAALAALAVIRLVGIDLTLKDGAGTSVGSQVGAVDVLAASLVAGLAAWGVFALLAHWRRARWWPFVGSTALAVSITGPSYLADGISAVALICLHVIVGMALILSFTRLMPRPYRGAGRAADHPQYHA